jgi:hypothetical protein
MADEVDDGDEDDDAVKMLLWMMHDFLYIHN